MQWPITERIAAHSAAFHFDQLPAKSVAIAKIIVLDTLGALFAAWPTRHDVSRILGDYVIDMGGVPESTVLGRNVKVPAANAALLNGTMGYAADIEGAGVARMHAAAVFVPTLLVMAERQHLDGKACIAALALAYDVAARASNAAKTPQAYPHSFHPSAVFGTFGAAAIGGYALRLNSSQFVNAYGLAGNVASGLVAWVDDPTEHSRSFGIGVAARNGVTAALLAERGFGGPRGIFDAAKYNIYDAFSGSMNLDAITEGLGSDFYIDQADGYKRYPCCGDIHSGLDALLGILEEEHLPSDSIAEITHAVRPTRRNIIDNNPLKSHNAQYIMSVAAVDRQIIWDDFLRDRREEQAIGAMFPKVRLIDAEELGHGLEGAPAIVSVKTHDGRTYRKQVNAARGRSENPLSREELEQKFIQLAVIAVSEARALEILDAVNHLETLSDVSDIIALMHQD